MREGEIEIDSVRVTERERDRQRLKPTNKKEEINRE